MARRLFLLLGLTAALHTVSAQQPEPPPREAPVQPPPPPAEKPPEPPPHEQKLDRRELPEGLRSKLERMSPEQREKFLRNYEKWKQMPPEERARFRKKDGEERRQMLRRSVDEALKQAGLNLSPEDREEFAMRYAIERRKLEEELHREIDARRKQLLPELIDRLKQEFLARNQQPKPEG